MSNAFLEQAAKKKPVISFTVNDLIIDLCETLFSNILIDKISHISWKRKLINNEYKDKAKEGQR